MILRIILGIIATWNLEHNAGKVQEILNRIMQGIISIITSALMAVMLEHSSNNLTWNFIQISVPLQYSIVYKTVDGLLLIITSYYTQLATELFSYHFRFLDQMLHFQYNCENNCGFKILTIPIKLVAIWWEINNTSHFYLIVMYFMTCMPRIIITIYITTYNMIRYKIWLI